MSGSGLLYLDAYLEVLDTYWRNSMCGALCTTLTGVLLLGIGLYGIYHFHSRPRPAGWLLLMILICGLGVFLSCSFLYKSFCLLMRRRELEDPTTVFNDPVFLAARQNREEYEMVDVRNLLTTDSPQSDAQSTVSPIDGARYRACASHGKSSLDYHVFDDSDVTADVSSVASSSNVRHDVDYEYTQFEMDDFPCRKKRKTDGCVGEEYGCDIETQV